MRDVLFIVATLATAACADGPQFEPDTGAADLATADAATTSDDGIARDAELADAMHLQPDAALYAGTDIGVLVDGGLRDIAPDVGPAADACTEHAPCALTPGIEASEFIFPRGDEDFYDFDVAVAGEIMSVVVSFDADFSPVELEVVLFSPDGIVIGSRRGVRGRQRVELQLSATTTGTHRILVRDVDGDGADDRNGYTVRVALLNQTDLNEPNDRANPTDLAIGEIVSGAIGTTGDIDWFRFSVPANHLVEIDVVAAGSSPVRFAWTLFEPTGTTTIASSLEPEGDVAWPIEVRAVGNTAGRYLIAVRDDDGLTADTTNVYSLRVRVLPEPDIYDVEGSNNTASTATMLQPDQSASGYIGAFGDFDYYAIQVDDASPSHPRLLVVDVQMARTSVVDLSMVVLDLDGETEVCANRDGDLCRARRFVVDGSISPAQLRTSHPIITNGTYYVLVADLGGDDADQGVGYSLTVRVEDDPDSNESFIPSGPDGAIIVPTTTPTTGQVIEFAWVEGFISHANDHDWYLLDIPGTSFGVSGDWLVQLELQMLAPTPVELQGSFYRTANPVSSYGNVGKRCRSASPDDADPCQFDDDDNGIDIIIGEANGDCFVVFREVTSLGPHYFRLTDLNRDDFDLDRAYRFRITLSAGCPPDSVCAGQFVDRDGEDLCGRP